MEPLTASFLLCSLKSIFCLHPQSSKKFFLTVAIHFKDSLLLLMPPTSRTPALATGAWRRSGKYSNIFCYCWRAAELLVCLHRGMPLFLSAFCFKQGDLSSVPVTNYNCRSKTQKSEAWKKKICFPRTDLTLSKTMLWLTAQRGNTQRFAPEQNVHLFYAVEDLIWFQSHWLDLCYWSPNTKAVSQRMAGFSYYLTLEVVE